MLHEGAGLSVAYRHPEVGIDRDYEIRDRPEHSDDAFKRNLVRQGLGQICSANWSGTGATPKDLVVRFHNDIEGEASFTFSISLRSPFAVFRYLGALMRSTPNAFRLQTEEALRRATDTSIIKVTRGRSHNCFAATVYRGSAYCVPERGAENTKQVFSILAQLVALSVTPGTLPVTSDVRLIQ
ncbi:hypothetical protein HFO81_22750 [Rhizobium leguminosarum]|uniref:hypothetical protein n=1 Tax=Rhizobium leguminosarum TaxID=384 RepID=UPI001C9651A9|nr:hypothetical protein [Rhizobium leguminosarum]MBY5508352.1 hypothetical protein [Rhizobium leguminosarum]